MDGNQKRTQRDAILSIVGEYTDSRQQMRSRQGSGPMVVTVVRTWEAEAPEGVEALEWLLLTSVAVGNEEQAWERVAWYRMRWIVEDYHQCLKTGCQIESVTCKAMKDCARS